MIQQANAARFEENMVNLLPKVSDMMPPRLKPRTLPREKSVASNKINNDKFNDVI